VEAKGFKTYSQPALQLRTGDTLELAIRLDLGDTTERVDVTAAAPILETGSSSLGQVIDERRLLELPQKGGDPFELMRLTPGFVNKAGQTKPLSQDNRYGLAVGGPVRIPHVYNGRNKTFFFYAWEENRFASPSTTSGQTSSVPTPAEKVGDFSALLALGSRYQIYNPFTTVAIAGGRFQRDPIPGNIIP